MTTVPYQARASAASALSRLAERHGTPITSIVQVTRRCNLRCRHSFQADRGIRELTTAEWERVFRRLADANVLLLTLSGGEPTLRRDLLDLVRIARGLSFAVKLKTNGVRLSERLCRGLGDAAVMEANVSLYAMAPARHDGLVGVPGSHRRTIASARRLRDAGIAVVLVCPLTSRTFDGYERLIEFALAEGFDYSFDTDIAVREDGCQDPARWRVPEAKLLRFLADPRVSPRPAKTAPPRRRASAPVCGVGRSAVVVAPNGDVWPCLRLPDPMGSLLVSTVPEIWNDSPVLRKYEQRWSDLPVCRKCGLRGFCARCPAAALHEDGDVRGPSSSACRAAAVAATAWQGAAGRSGRGSRVASGPALARSPLARILTHGLGRSARARAGRRPDSPSRR